MSKPTNVGDNPNDKMPPGKGLDHDVIVPDGDAGLDESAGTETGDVNHQGFDPANETRTSDQGGRTNAKEFEGLDNDLVNVGKFNDPAVEGNLNASATGKRDNRTVAEAFDIDPHQLYKDPAIRNP